MRSPNCLNCRSPLLASQNYCAHCGQKADTRRITFRQLGSEFFQSIFNAERGLLRLAKGLIVNPGKVAVEYVEGKRKRYFNPFAFLALCLAASLFINGLIKPYRGTETPDPFIELRMPNEEMRELYRETIRKTAAVQKFGNANLNILSVAAAPYFAFFLWLFFRDRKRSVAEITVVYIMYTAITVLLGSIIISPLLAATKETWLYWPLFCLSLFLQTLYIVWGLNAFFNYKTVSGYFKILGALFLIGLIGFIILMGSLFVYIYHGKYMQVFQYM